MITVKFDNEVAVALLEELTRHPASSGLAAAGRGAIRQAIIEAMTQGAPKHLSEMDLNELPALNYNERELVIGYVNAGEDAPRTGYVQAIKAYRERNDGVGLKQAKDKIDAFRFSLQPDPSFD